MGLLCLGDRYSLNTCQWLREENTSIMFGDKCTAVTCVITNLCFPICDRYIFYRIPGSNCQGQSLRHLFSKLHINC